MKTNFKSICAHGGVEKLEGSIFDLLSEIPYLLINKYILPMRIINSILSNGGYEGGQSGGCTWKPFEIDNSQYENLVEKFIDKGFEKVNVPNWVNDEETWGIFILELKFGIPHEKVIEFNNKTKQIQNKLEMASKQGNEELEGKYCLELVHLSIDENELFDKYTRKPS